METFVELTPDRKLLCTDFKGYYLTLDPLPIHRLNLSSGVDRVHPNEDQYSFLHAKVFGLHNHLFVDPWCPGTVYYIDKNWGIQGTVEEFGRVAALKKFWDVPKPQTEIAGRYNLSLSFPSYDICIVSDGIGNLHLLNTGDRSHSTEEWKVIFSGRIPDTGEGFVLLDSRIMPDDAMLGEAIKAEEVHCLILEVNEKLDSELSQKTNNDSSRNSSKFVSTINWVTFAVENDQWSVKSVVTLSAAGGVDYAAIEEGCKALYIAGNRPFEFNTKLDQDSKTAAEENSKGEEIPCPFTWMQTADDITVTVNVPSGTAKSDVTVTVTGMFLSISVKADVLLDGFLQNRVDAKLTTWSVKDDKLEVLLSKEEGGLSWRSLIRGDPRGEVLDPAFVEEVRQKLAHLCSETEETGASSGTTSGVSSQQLEECDEVPSDTSVLLRLDLEQRKATHKASLSNHQWLFNARLLGAQVPAGLCLRHDVDACVWQPDKLVESTEIWPVRHIGTFHAFGYVQASKQERKFSVCSPDMCYVCVCETSRHVYIYRQPGEFGVDIRRRSTGERVKKVARQHVVQLDAGSEVLGCHAACDKIFVLTTATLFVISAL